MLRLGSSGRSLSHIAVVRRSTETGSPTERASVTSNVRNRPAVTATGRPRTDTASGPRTATDNVFTVRMSTGPSNLKEIRAVTDIDTATGAGERWTSPT